MKRTLALLAAMTLCLPALAAKKPPAPAFEYYTIGTSSNAPVTTGAGGGLGSKHHSPGHTDLANLSIGVSVPSPALVPLDPQGVFSKLVGQRACLNEIAALR